ncbi:hypothetical protein KAJ27_24545 [bacterium]|nr:hypothetical protein [bacterium]
MTVPTQEQLMEQFNISSNYLEDIFNGKTTIAQTANVSKDEMEEYLIKGQNALQLEDFEKAEEIFTTILVLNNKDTRAALGLGGALEGQGKFEFAVPIYYMVVVSTLYDPVAPFRAGVCMMQLGKKEDAKKFFQLAADCEKEIKDPKKTIYVERAKGMLKAIS